MEAVLPLVLLEVYSVLHGPPPADQVACVGTLDGVATAGDGDVAGNVSGSESMSGSSIWLK